MRKSIDWIFFDIGNVIFYDLPLLARIFNLRELPAAVGMMETEIMNNNRTECLA